MNFTLALQVISFLISHKDDVKQIVLALEQLAGDMKGSDKAQAFKGWLSAAMGLADQIEQAWPVVAPIFNLAVAAIKGKAA